MQSPPPISTPRVQSCTPIKSSKILVAFGFVCILGIAFLVACRIAGLLIPYKIPTNSMSPTLAAGDSIIMEGFSALTRDPRRGEIIVFKTDGIRMINSSSVYAMRLVGEAGEHLELRDDTLFVNGIPTVITSESGNITYPSPKTQMNLQTDIMIPDEQWFVIGDNSTNSFDSRYWGPVPGENIRGKVWFRYWPLNRIGFVK